MTKQSSQNSSENTALKENYIDSSSDLIKNRVYMLANYLAENGTTVRETAKKYGISKSTVHKDLTQRLNYYNPKLYDRVRTVLEKNKAERHMRGGLATKQKYLVLNKKKVLAKAGSK